MNKIGKDNIELYVIKKYGQAISAFMLPSNQTSTLASSFLRPTTPPSLLFTFIVVVGDGQALERVEDVNGDAGGFVSDSFEKDGQGPTK
jgi:hypothetical protein